VVRFDGPLFFANATFLEDQITARMQAKKDLSTSSWPPAA
jgi:MFS superfamily sulfate permease-like transporter